MRFLKWFFEDSSSEQYVAKEYAEMPDRKLAGINPAELTPVGLKCYREEIQRRKAKSSEAQSAERNSSVK